MLNTLNGRVWIDTDRDGIQDSQEAGSEGVSVTLIGAGPDGVFGTADDTTETAITDRNGAYTFRVPDGEYKLAFGEKMGYRYTAQNVGTDDGIDSDPDSAGSTAPFTLAHQALVTYDAGLVLGDTHSASLGDRVWLDANGNGVQDKDEAGAAGVKVTLRSAGADGIVDTPDDAIIDTVTDANGHYSFSGLSAGDYRVSVEAQEGYAFTTADAGGNDAADSDVNAKGHVNVTLGIGESNQSVDAGLLVKTPVDPHTASIGDKVWIDANGNGVQDGGEAGLAGVNVSLYSYTTGVTQTTSTDGGGNYNFANLSAGHYYVLFGGTAGYQFTSTDTGGNDAIDSDANAAGYTAAFDLAAGQQILTIDAGMTLTDPKNASIGDRVWLDADRDGVQDSGEAGVSGVTVTLQGAGADGVLGSGDDTSATTTTNSTGAYSFTDLAAGQYQVTFGGKSGYSFTTANVGNDTTDSDANSAGQSHVITLAAGQADMSVDAGLLKDICAKIVSSAGATGTVTMNEGAQQSFKIQLDSTVMQDTQFWVQVNDGSAQRTNFNASSQIVHADPRKLSTDYNMTNSGSQQSREHRAFKMRGPSDMSWDYGVYDTSGNIVGSQSGFWVTVKAGASTSATFSVSAWKEFVDVDKDGSSTYNTRKFSSTEIRNKVWLEDSVENFSLELTQSGNPSVVVCDPTTSVNIVDKSTYDVTSPIILDLDGNGVQTTALDASAGVFDLLGNGKAVASGWASSGDGFLAIDVNGNGKIDDIGELFGGRVGEGFAKLGGFDSNGDGVVDAADADFDKLLVWQDANGNRQTDAGELRTLGEAGIASLNTDNWFQNVEQNGNVLGETSTATRTDGSSIEMIDAYFKYEELPALDSLVEADNALFDSVLGGGSARELPAIADIAFDAAGEAQRVIAEAMKQADASLAVAV